jgi:UTP pyrophosphatase
MSGPGAGAASTLSTSSLRYIAHYPQPLQEQVRELLAQGSLGAMLSRKYKGQAHDVRTDNALYTYVMALKNEYLRKADPLAKAVFDSKLHVVNHALGTHTNVARVQGSKLKAKREIRVATLFKTVPEPLLKMIVVHELAHIKESQHDKAFYQLCCHMESAYHQLEFDLRLVLTHVDMVGAVDWSA